MSTKRNNPQDSRDLNHYFSNMTMDNKIMDLLDRIEVLLEEESQWHYPTSNYLLCSSQQQTGEGANTRNASRCSSANSQHPSRSSLLSNHLNGRKSNTQTNMENTGRMNYVWREQMVQWAYQAVDYLGFSRELVSIGMESFDHLLSASPPPSSMATARDEQVQKKDFQLLAVTCLYLAIKYHEPLCSHSDSQLVDTMVDLSNGQFTKEEIILTEEDIVQKLQWLSSGKNGSSEYSRFQSPKTPLVFLRHYLQCLQEQGADERHHELFDKSCFYIELSVLDFFFLSHKSSTIAMAALLNAIEEDSSSSSYNSTNTSYLDYEEETISTLWESLTNESRLNLDDIMLCRERFSMLTRSNDTKKGFLPTTMTTATMVRPHSR